MPNVRPTSLSPRSRTPLSCRSFSHTVFLRPQTLVPRSEQAKDESKTRREAIQPEEQSTIVRKGDSGSKKTYRKRQHGNGSLPLPPLMDPVAIEARTRHKLPKLEEAEAEEMTEFQKALAANPYGTVFALQLAI